MRACRADDFHSHFVALHGGTTISAFPLSPPPLTLAEDGVCFACIGDSVLPSCAVEGRILHPAEESHGRGPSYALARGPHARA